MKILKSFKTDEHIMSCHSGQTEWGLNDSGDLCARCTIKDCRRSEYWQKNPLLLNGLSISEMKRIVDNFHHLLVFI